MPAHAFINDPHEALFSVLAVNVWVEIGYCVTIFLAGIQTIPQDCIEAARIDGASEGKVLRRIILPLLMPITFFLAIMEGIQFLRIFTPVDNMSMRLMIGIVQIVDTPGSCTAFVISPRSFSSVMPARH